MPSNMNTHKLFDTPSFLVLAIFYYDKHFSETDFEYRTPSQYRFFHASLFEKETYGAYLKSYGWDHVVLI